MAINPKEKKMLQEMWDGADDASGADIPDGTYQFKIVSARFHMTDKNKPTFKTKVKIVGGDEEYVGKELELNDNLETAQNMGFFKKKLRRLNIVVTEDFDDIVDGAIAEEMTGKTFEGQVKMKNDFLNVYVNRLVSDGGGEEDEQPKKKGEEEEEAETSKSKKAAFEEGDKVTWGEGKEGEIVEVLEDEGKARVQKEDETIVRVSLDLLEKAEKKSSKKKDEEEEEEGGKKKKEEDALELPSPDEVDDMKAGKVRETLEALGFEDADDLKDPRGVLHAFSTLAEDPEAKIALAEVKPLADALGVELDKSEPMKAQLKQLAKAVAKRLS